MIDPTRIDYGRVASVAKNGSPLLLQALGRLYGIGPVERSAFGQTGGGVPTWAWVALSFGVGIVVGTRLYKHYPDYVPNMIAGD